MTSYHTLEASFPTQPSLHPTLSLSIKSSSTSPLPPSPTECHLHAFIQLNDKLFIDSYELADRWGESSEMGNASKLVEKLKSLKGKGNVRPEWPVWRMDPPVLDLERPVRTSEVGGSVTSSSDGKEAVLHMVLGSWESEGNWTVEVPLHSRYQAPTESGQEIVTLGSERGESDCSVWAYWACIDDSVEATTAMSKLSLQPITFDPSNPQTFTFHNLALPTAITAHQPIVELGTLIAVLSMWIWVGKVIWEVVQGGESKEGEVVLKEKEEVFETSTDEKKEEGPKITISYTINPPSGQTSSIPSTQTTSFPLTSSPSTTSTDPSKPFSSHYIPLLTSLTEAQKSLNRSLTTWKDTLGDSEKHKELVLVNGKKGGRGKAMEMVIAAREVDGRSAEGSKKDTGVVQKEKEVKVGMMGLISPEDDVESSEEDEEVGDD